MTMTEAVKLSGLNEGTVWGRLHLGWTEAAALTTPVIRQREPRMRNAKHCAFIRGLPCLVTGRKDGVECAHIRYADFSLNKTEAGIGAKPSDCWTVPLSAHEHRLQHSRGERAYWRELGINPLVVALALYEVSGDDEAGEEILRKARK